MSQPHSGAAGRGAGLASGRRPPGAQPRPLRLDPGYRAITPVELAIVRKRPALPPVPGEPVFSSEEVAAKPLADLLLGRDVSCHSEPLGAREIGDGGSALFRRAALCVDGKW